jgi:fucose permease
MSAIKNLIEKTKGNKVFLAGTVIGVLALVLIVGVIAGSILIFGLNLMGFVIPYTMKTIFGAAIVISCLRSMGSDSK